MEEKETQCQTFRELLLEKESDIAQLSETLEKANIDNQPEVDAKTKLSNVLEALGQNISSEESFDSLLEKVINITDGTGNQEESFVGVDAENDEKKKLLEKELEDAKNKLKEGQTHLEAEKVLDRYNDYVYQIWTKD